MAAAALGAWDRPLWVGLLFTSAALAAVTLLLGRTLRARLAPLTALVVGASALIILAEFRHLLPAL